jgi:hypothetical protein
VTAPNRYYSILHPDYVLQKEDFKKFRLTYQGGRQFIDEYLVKNSRREKLKDFQLRRDMTYCPAFAKAAVDEVKNAVFQRLADVSRADGPESYQRACKGELGGVDMMNGSMTSFLGRTVLPELLPMSKVGIWVDNGVIDENDTKETTQGVHPYLYIYRIEDIRSWTFLDGPQQGRFKSLLLCDREYQYEPGTDLPIGWYEKYRYVWLDPRDNKVHVRCQYEGALVDERTKAKETEEIVLDLDRIPFVLLDIGSSLLQDAADIQIALLNMASNDVNYAVKANFPFYIEQFDPRSTNPYTRPAQQGTKTATDGTEIPAGQAKQGGEAKNDEIVVGTGQGRRYGLNLNAPAFIHPSPEPLRVSMEKQRQMVADLRHLVHLAVASLDPKLASAESKSMDNRGLENGLSAIALELEQAEREIAVIWALYEKTKPAIVRYPEIWSMQTDQERREDAKELAGHIDLLPSKTAQKEIAKQVATKLIGHKVTSDMLAKIHAEIDKAEAVTAKSEFLLEDVKNGLVPVDMASKLRGYPEGAAKRAQEEHAKRLAIIAIAQSEGAGAARGVPNGPTDSSAKDEKELAKNTDKDPVPTDKVRGEA